ncbi:MAG: NAD(P)(+) transhydrogenase (Re/Si-specific) subunit beta [Thermoanaerobaculia bacterium]
MASWVPGLLVPLLYLLSAILFILGLKGMTRVPSARRGAALAAVGMLLAVVGTLLEMGVVDYRWILAGLVVGGAVGAVAALKVEMTAMPEMVALFNGCGGGASALVALGLVAEHVAAVRETGTLAARLGGETALTAVLSVLIGAVTLSGSVVAFLKLRGWMPGRPLLLPGRHALNLLLAAAALAAGAVFAVLALETPTIAVSGLLLVIASLVLGVLLVIPIGGADMPVVIALLNSYSGLAAAATGFVLDNNMLIIAGALVGASGLILTRIMCQAMNRTMLNVVLGGFGAEEGAAASAGGEYETVRSAGAQEVALLLDGADSVIFVPGYGLAVAQAQHTVKELADALEARGSKVVYAIHPVAGRMPGHMNVLLAEADVPYEQLVEMERINSEFRHTDVVLVVGANDVVNPAAQSTPGSPIYGMPVLQVWEARSVVVVKRSLSPGFAGIKNDLFERPNTVMLFADAKQAVQEIVTELKGL